MKESVVNITSFGNEGVEYLFIENLATYYLIFSLLSALHRVDKSLVCILAFNPFKKEGEMKKKIYRQKLMS